VALLATLAAVMVHRTGYGRSLLAVGQSREAAYLSGVRVRRTVLVAYVISGACAGLAGVLLAGSVGSADLELGNAYLLASVGAVVLGGTRIAGGNASVVGTLLGAFLLTLLANAVAVAGFGLEEQNIARGIVITLVLVAASGAEAGAVRGRVWRVLRRRDPGAGGRGPVSGPLPPAADDMAELSTPR
jgi:ribose transport system permease protein